MIIEKQKFNKQYGALQISQFLMLGELNININDKSLKISGNVNTPVIQINQNTDGELTYQFKNNPKVYIWTPANGNCPLDQNNQIPSQYLPFNIYTSTQANINNQQGNQGDLLVTTDSQKLYSYIDNEWRPIGNSISFDQIQPPTASFDLNSQKITNLQQATLSTDAVNFGQLDRNHFVHAYLDNNVTNVGSGNVLSTYNILFNQFIEPNTLTPPISSYIQQSIDNSDPSFPFTVFTLQQGVYTINIKTLIQYKGSTQYPIQFYLYDLVSGTISYTLIEGDNIDNFNQKKITNNSVVLKVTSTKQIALQFQLVPQYINQICSGTSMYIQRIN